MHDLASLTQLALNLKTWAGELGFSGLGIAQAKIGKTAADYFLGWLNRQQHGEMGYLSRHAALRLEPEKLMPGAKTVIVASLGYWPGAARTDKCVPEQKKAAVSCYALGWDYHKIMRRRLLKLAKRLESETGKFAYRVFSDSAPVMEVELAQKSGLGWRGKHGLLLSRQGSWQFLGAIYTDLPLPVSPEEPPHCGRCDACIKICPTRAITAPYQLDARRCISYLTIELPGSIPENFRPLIGNRIYGCDDCQLCCPWNRFARLGDPEFCQKTDLNHVFLADLLELEEGGFNTRFAQSPIRRIGHERWLRNIAVALGNGGRDEKAVKALFKRLDHPSSLVREHVAWALLRLGEKI